MADELNQTKIVQGTVRNIKATTFTRREETDDLSNAVITLRVYDGSNLLKTYSTEDSTLTRTTNTAASQVVTFSIDTNDSEYSNKLGSLSYRWQINNQSDETYRGTFAIIHPY